MSNKLQTPKVDPQLYHEVIIACLMPKFDPALQEEFLTQYEPLIKYIREKWPSTAFRTTVESLNLRKKNRPRVLLVVNEDVTLIEHVGLRGDLAKYVETGGTVIFCCWFATKSSTMGVDSVLWEYHCDWSVKQGLEQFIRTNMTINPALQQTIGDHFVDLLETTYPIQAVHLQGVAVSNQVYLAPPGKEEETIAAVDPHREGTPSAFRKHGKGFLGFVGDNGYDLGTQAVILAMIHASAPAAGPPKKQAFAGSAVNPPADLAHATPPAKYQRDAVKEVDQRVPEAGIVDPYADMPALTPCDTGCAVCMIRFPAYHCCGCRVTQYCSLECQEKDWLEHKLVCASLKKGDK